jgi:uncharacterized protein (DUF924 family)
LKTIKTPTASQQVANHSPAFNSNCVGLERDDDVHTPTQWFDEHAYDEKSESSQSTTARVLFDRSEARNLFEQFELDGGDKVSPEKTIMNVHMNDTNRHHHKPCLDEALSHEESPFLLSAELTSIMNSDFYPGGKEEEEEIPPVSSGNGDDDDEFDNNKDYSWEPMVKHKAPCAHKELPSFVPTLESVSETSTLKFYLMKDLGMTGNSHPSTDDILDATQVLSPVNKKQSKRKSSKSSSRREDTYGLWMQKQAGASNRFEHIFQALHDRNFAMIESELELLEAENDKENPSLLTIDYPRDDYGNTLLMVACHNGSKRSVRWCLSQGADVDIKNKYGNTSLHFAVEFGLEKIAAHLQDKQNANSDILNNLGLNCFQRAADCKSVKHSDY